MLYFSHSTRRDFVRNGLALIGAGFTVPTFLTRSAQALSFADGGDRRGGPAGADSPILVVIQLAGGNDGLNTVVPFRDDAYHRARPKLGLKEKAIVSLSGDFGLNAQAAGLKKLWDAGHLAIVQGVGYPNPNRSHFASTEIWETADPQEKATTGWIGRYFDNCCSGSAALDPRLGVAVVKEDPLAMRGSRFQPIAFKSPERLAWSGDKSNKFGQDIYEFLNRAPKDEAARAAGSNSAPGSDPQGSTLDYLRRVSYDARLNVDQIREAASGIGGGPKTDLLSDLEMILRMIRAGLPTRVYYASLSGFDTHAQQAGRHNDLLKELGDAMALFVRELEKDRLLDRVMIFTFSEFGRRVEENASGGTDHGVAAPLFVAGGRVKPGFYGRHPSLTDLDSGDLKHTTDFRSVYATALGAWMRADDAQILGGKFPRIDLLKSAS